MSSDKKKAGSSSFMKNKTSKRWKLEDDIQQLDFNKKLGNIEVIKKMSLAWQGNTNYQDENGFTVSRTPFAHVEIDDFISNKDWMDSFYQRISTEVTFSERATDLLQFRQSDDLTLTSISEIKAIRLLLETKCLNLLVKLTNFPLNGKVDMFLSQYRQTDFLLCHDDELDSRRIAFILYLSHDWKPEYGGSLDFFESSEDIQPKLVTKSIVPAFNKFVFFTVTCKSFHQVGEVIEPGVSRFALSGWFYGEAIPRPKIVLPQVEYYTPKISPMKDILHEYIADVYSKKENCETINEQLVEDSQAFLVDFLKQDSFVKISEELNHLEWEISGPANIHRFLISKTQLWPYDDSHLLQPVNKLAAFFHSDEFFSLMERITEYSFNQAVSVTSSLRKYEHKCYSLLKIENELDNDNLRQLDTQEESSSGTDDYNLEESEEEDTHVDLIYYCGNFDWTDEWGGLTIYTDEEGEQLITVTPRSNSLALIIRNKSVNSYVNYINSLANNGSFFTYTMTFSFKGKV